jgi:NAD-dependent SIR2 family protein deacetylase
MTADKHRPDNRVIPLGEGLASVPEKLLLEHSQGKVLFVTGAGISQPAKLPSFKKMVQDVYAEVDTKVHSVISVEFDPKNGRDEESFRGLTSRQKSEVNRFDKEDYDVVLGMLERRYDLPGENSSSKVRQAVLKTLLVDGKEPKPAPIHRALMRLADRGGAVTIVTTNFDLLLEKAAKNIGQRPKTYALGSIPRPSRNKDFEGVLHIHGAVEKGHKGCPSLIVTDQDFGEFYLRRRSVSDFIYDAARLFHIVLIGYRMGDPPLQYLFNAVAADRSRFEDIKDCYAFVQNEGGEPDPVELEDWRGRGIIPIPYSKENDHSVLLETLEAWAKLSANNGKRSAIDAKIKRLVEKKREDANDADRFLFDHLIRRSDVNERMRIAELIASKKAGTCWLDAIAYVLSEKTLERA